MVSGIIGQQKSYNINGPGTPHVGVLLPETPRWNPHTKGFGLLDLDSPEWGYNGFEKQLEIEQWRQLDIDYLSLGQSTYPQRLGNPKA
jgi:hypothetical protein